MNKLIQKFEIRARDCREKASRSKDPWEKDAWLEFSKQWLGLAEAATIDQVRDDIP
jgi:hypothetical protein